MREQFGSTGLPWTLVVACAASLACGGMAESPAAGGAGAQGPSAPKFGQPKMATPEMRSLVLYLHEPPEVKAEAREFHRDNPNDSVVADVGLRFQLALEAALKQSGFVTTHNRMDPYDLALVVSQSYRDYGLRVDSVGPNAIAQGLRKNDSGGFSARYPADAGLRKRQNEAAADLSVCVTRREALSRRIRFAPNDVPEVVAREVANDLATCDQLQAFVGLLHERRADATPVAAVAQQPPAPRPPGPPTSQVDIAQETRDRVRCGLAYLRKYVKNGKVTTRDLALASGLYADRTVEPTRYTAAQAALIEKARGLAFYGPLEKLPTGQDRLMNVDPPDMHAGDILVYYIQGEDGSHNAVLTYETYDATVGAGRAIGYVGGAQVETTIERLPLSVEPIDAPKRWMRPAFHWFRPQPSMCSELATESGATSKGAASTPTSPRPPRTVELGEDKAHAVRTLLIVPECADETDCAVTLVTKPQRADFVFNKDPRAPNRILVEELEGTNVVRRETLLVSFVGNRTMQATFRFRRSAASGRTYKIEAQAVVDSESKSLPTETYGRAMDLNALSGPRP